MEILMVIGGFGHEKTNPNKLVPSTLLRAGSKQRRMEPILFSPQIFWGLKTQFEKTKPICLEANRCKVLYERILWQ